MLTSDESGQTMVMSPGYLKIAIGDTVTFVPSDASHNVESIIVPRNTKALASQIGHKFSYTFDQQGLYFYKCTPHFALGMLGVIQVGMAHNVEDVRKAWIDISPGVVMNKSRINSYLSQIK